MKKTLKLLILFFALVGCASLTKEGEKVRLTLNENDVSACKFIENIKIGPPYWLPSDWKKKLRNKAGTVGGNTVLTKKPGLKVYVEGKVYTCHR